jgi:tRNA C32,U32 (ribose-2'-O)-methylase TrmJ
MPPSLTHTTAVARQTSRRAARLAVGQEAQGMQLAVLFGNERSGLSNDELKRCTETVAIPTAAVPSTNPKDPLVQSSLNLSHAVAVLCYEVCAGGTALRSCEAWEDSSTRFPANGSI